MLHHHLIRVMYVFAQKKEALWEETLRWTSQSIRNVSELLPTRSTAVTIVYLAAFRFKLEQIKAGKEDYDVDLWPFLIQKRHRFVILSLTVTLRRYWDIAFMKTGQKTIKHNDFSDGFSFCLL